MIINYGDVTGKYMIWWMLFFTKVSPSLFRNVLTHKFAVNILNMTSAKETMSRKCFSLGCARLPDAQLYRTLQYTSDFGGRTSGNSCPLVWLYELFWLVHNKKQKIAGLVVHDDHKTFPTCFESVSYFIALSTLNKNIKGS